MRRLATCLAVALVMTVLMPGLALAQDSPAALKAKLEADSHVQFQIPEAFQQQVKGDELQIGDKEIFCAISCGKSVDASFDSSMTILKKMGGDSYKVKKGPATDTQEGITGKYASGTLTLNGKEIAWMVFVFDAGGKPLSMTLMGDGLLDNASAKSLVDSIKKK